MSATQEQFATAEVRRSLGTRYEIIRLLGTGAFGEVYEAEDLALRGSRVAMKLLHDNLINRTQDLQHLAARLAELRSCPHENLVRIYEISVETEPRFYTMELVPGCSLADVTLAARKTLNWQLVVAVLEQILQGLAAAHLRGIVHRDLKPANVLLTAEGTAKLTDFGFYSLADVSAQTLSECEEFGTPAYMAPEQFRAEDTTPATDVYAFSVLAFELLSGRRPFEDTKYFRLAERHLTEPFPDLLDLRPEIPRWLAGLIVRCAAKEPELRPQNAAEVLTSFREHPVTRNARPDLIALVESASRERRNSPRISRRAAIWTGASLFTSIFLIMMVRSNVNLNSRIGAHVLALERQLHISLHAPKRLLRLQGNWQNPSELFEGLLAESAVEGLLNVNQAFNRAWIRSGADMNIRYSGPNQNLRGATPLIVNIQSAPNKDKELRDLLQFGADPNLKDRKHNTALHYAVLDSNEPYLYFLLERGANPFECNRLGRAPIHLAIEQGDLNKVRVLFNTMVVKRSRKELANHKTADGRSPLELAQALRAEDREAIVRMLVSFGAEQPAEKTALKQGS